MGVYRFFYWSRYNPPLDSWFTAPLPLVRVDPSSGGGGVLRGGAGGVFCFVSLCLWTGWRRSTHPSMTAQIVLCVLCKGCNSSSGQPASFYQPVSNTKLPRNPRRRGFPQMIQEADPILALGSLFASFCLRESKQKQSKQKEKGIIK